MAIANPPAEVSTEERNRELIEAMWCAHHEGFRAAYKNAFGVDLDEHVTWAQLADSLNNSSENRRAFLGRLARLPIGYERPRSVL